MALWGAFAVASVGVGFGAAGLVGDPFSDGVVDASPAAGVGAAPTPSASMTPSGGPPTPAASISPSQSKIEVPSGTARPTRSIDGPEPAESAAPARAVSRTLTTRGGLVSATCRSDLIRVSGSPAVGWQIEDIDGGPQRYARVRFEPIDGDGRVDLEATCSRGTPRFALDDEVGGGEDGGGEDGGSEDGGGGESGGGESGGDIAGDDPDAD